MFMSVISHFWIYLSLGNLLLIWGAPQKSLHPGYYASHLLHSYAVTSALLVICSMPYHSSMHPDPLPFCCTPIVDPVSKRGISLYQHFYLLWIVCFLMQNG